MELSWQRDYFNCTCGCGSILMERYSPDDEDVSLSIWEQRQSKVYRWGDRLRLIWKILREGYAFADDIILEKKDALLLGQKLIEFATRNPETVTTGGDAVEGKVGGGKE